MNLETDVYDKSREQGVAICDETVLQSCCICEYQRVVSITPGGGNLPGSRSHGRRALDECNALFKPRTRRRQNTALGFVLRQISSFIIWILSTIFNTINEAKRRSTPSRSSAPFTPHSVFVCIKDGVRGQVNRHWLYKAMVKLRHRFNFGYGKFGSKHEPRIIDTKTLFHYQMRDICLYISQLHFMDIRDRFHAAVMLFGTTVKVYSLRIHRHKHMEKLKRGITVSMLLLHMIPCITGIPIR